MVLLEKEDFLAHNLLAKYINLYYQLSSTLF